MHVVTLHLLVSSLSPFLGLVLHICLDLILDMLVWVVKCSGWTTWRILMLYLGLDDRFVVRVDLSSSFFFRSLLQKILADLVCDQVTPEEKGHTIDMTKKT